MKQRDDSTIHIFKDKAGKYRFNLVSDQNGKTVGCSSKGYRELKELYQFLWIVANEGHCIYHTTDKRGQYRFLITDYLESKNSIRSESYHNPDDRDNGDRACFKSLESARVALLFSEDSTVYDLQQLIDNPNLGIVTT